MSTSTVELIDLSLLDFDPDLTCEVRYALMESKETGEVVYRVCGQKAKYLVKVNHCVPFELLSCEWCTLGKWDCRVCDAENIGSPTIKGTI